jgi:DNA-binding response OmpR family regulator
MAPRRILIADDDVDALRLVGMMLERQGYEILAAANGQQALLKAIEAQPDLIILDVMMPDMDGYQVAGQLRSHPATDAIPILMFSAKTGVNDKIAGFQAGADDYVTKPIRPKDLATRVETLLERRADGDAEFDEGHLIGFLPTKGGSGTSTLALNTAIEMCKMYPDKRNALIELQPGRGTLAVQLGVGKTQEDGPGGYRHRLPDLLKLPLSYITEKSLVSQLTQHASGLRVLLASDEPIGTGPELNKRYLRTILQYLSHAHDYLVLDLPSDLSAPYREALGLCESILMTVEPNQIGVTLAQRMLEGLDNVGVGSQKVRVILLHRVPALGTLSRNMIEQTLHRDMIASIPPMPDLAVESAQNGRPMVDIQPQSLIAQQVRRIVQSVVVEADASQQQR